VNTLRDVRTLYQLESHGLRARVLRPCLILDPSRPARGKPAFRSHISRLRVGQNAFPNRDVTGSRFRES